MLKRFVSFLGAVVFAFGVFSGCTDAPTSTGNDSFDKAGLVTATTTDQMTDEALFGDPTRPPMPPPGSDMRPKSYERILRLLNLTDRQKAAVKGCLDEYRDCAKGNRADYMAARRTLMERFHAAAAAIRAQVEAGTKTPEEARAAMRELTAAVRERMAVIERMYARAMAGCESDLTACITPILTAEQLATWRRLVGGATRHP